MHFKKEMAAQAWASILCRRAFFPFFLLNKKPKKTTTNKHSKMGEGHANIFDICGKMLIRSLSKTSLPISTSISFHCGVFVIKLFQKVVPILLEIGKCGEVFSNKEKILLPPSLHKHVFLLICNVIMTGLFGTFMLAGRQHAQKTNSRIDLFSKHLFVNQQHHNPSKCCCCCCCCEQCCCCCRWFVFGFYEIAQVGQISHSL